jgi:hypothetical protein
MPRQVLVTTFDREEDILGAVEAARTRGLEIVDAYTPYAVHKLDVAIDVTPTRLPLVCFGTGLFGAAAMLGFEYWSNTVSWATNVGGRPWNSLPAFVPITFEAMVLCAGIGTVVAFLIVAGLRPWRRAALPDARALDDRFALVLAGEGLRRSEVEPWLTRFRPASIVEDTL